MADVPITELQAQLLVRLEGARLALTRVAPGLARDQMRDVVEELGHSGALLATIKKDLDAIFARLAGMRQALAAAFPEHVQQGRCRELEDELEGLKVEELQEAEKHERHDERVEEGRQEGLVVEERHEERAAGQHQDEQAAEVVAQVEQRADVEGGGGQQPADEQGAEQEAGQAAQHERSQQLGGGG